MDIRLPPPETVLERLVESQFVGLVRLCPRLPAQTARETGDTNTATDSKRLTTVHTVCSPGTDKNECGQFPTVNRQAAFATAVIIFAVVA
jgi:hypothetical protein